MDERCTTLQGFPSRPKTLSPSFKSPILVHPEGVGILVESCSNFPLPGVPTIVIIGAAFASDAARELMYMGTMSGMMTPGNAPFLSPSSEKLRIPEYATIGMVRDSFACVARLGLVGSVSSSASICLCVSTLVSMP